MTNQNPKVDVYFKSVKKWYDELQMLRKIILDCSLTEELKWRVPCYTLQGSNIVIIGGFKEYCALTFVKGVLLKDSTGILLKPGESTQSARLIRFTRVQEIVNLEPVLKAYINEAIDVEKTGLKVIFKKTPEPVPEELQSKLDEIPALKTAWNVLTPGRQRAYILYFSAPKQSKSKQSRIENSMLKILAGKGINDCTCGLSKRLPACDGSHKAIR